MALDRLRFRLSTNARRNVVDAVLKAPMGHIVEIREETRTDQQNKLMWPLLDDVSKQVRWGGRDLISDDWKNGFMMALSRSEYVPGIVPGTVWPLGLRSSTLGKAKFSELIELIYAFGAENAVKFRTDKATTMQEIERMYSRSKKSSGGETSPKERADTADGSGLVSAREISGGVR